jgi:hypothetical protein
LHFGDVARVDDFDVYFAAMVRQEPGSWATNSLAIATHVPSGARARSRMGSVHLARISSKLFDFREYLDTVQSSEPTMKKSF